jgi:hypothetical protein
MNNLVLSPTLFKVLGAVSLVIAAKVLESESLLVPLFSLCGDSGDSGDSGDTGSCSGDTSGDTTGSLGSTPFLCTWNGSTFVFENDVLFGKPRSFFYSKEGGKKQYEEGLVTGDLYKLSNTIEARNGRIPFQLKEIEPEESYIDYLSLLQVTHPREGEVIVSSDFSNYLVFERKALESQEGIEHTSITFNATSLENDLCRYSDETRPLEMHTGDTIDLKVKVRNTDTPLFFILGSQYRDWTIGELPDLTKKESVTFIQERIREILSEGKTLGTIAVGSVKIVALTFVLGAAWLVSSVPNFVSQDKSEDTAKLAHVFGINEARADVPYSSRSLVVECLMNGTYEQLDVIQPRYYQRTLEAIRVPQGAIDSGFVNLRVTATKRHNVTNAFFVAPDRLLSSEATDMRVVSACKRGGSEDCADTLNDKYSGEYLHTTPSDVVDIEFGPVPEKSEIPGMTHTYILKAHGYYTPLSEETKNRVGDWTTRLDADSRAVLQDLYALKTETGSSST